MAKIANYEIEAHISALAPFINYNSSIVANRENGFYRVWHWETQILTYNINTGVIDHLHLSTTSYEVFYTSRKNEKCLCDDEAKK